MMRTLRSTARGLTPFIGSVSGAEEVTFSAGADAPSDDALAPAEDGAELPFERPLVVRSGRTDLFVDRVLTRERREGQDVLVLRGRTSRELVAGWSFVHAGQASAFRKLGGRSFELVRAVGDAAPLLAGDSQFIGLDFEPAAGRPGQLSARVLIRPRVTTSTGSIALSLVNEIVPVMAAGRIVYRVTGRATGKLHGLAAQAAGVYCDVERTADTGFRIDLTAGQVLSAAGGGGELTVRVTLAGRVVMRRAELGLTVKRLGITAGDVREVWPLAGGPLILDDRLRVARVGDLPA